jgi:predicted amidohydrolase
MEKQVIVTAASVNTRWADIEYNLASIEAAACRAAEESSRLLLLPECCLTGADWPTGVTSPPVQDVALPLKSRAVAKLVELAKDTGVCLAVGLYENLRGRVHVTQAIVSPRGLIGAYRKVHEFARSSREKELFPVFDLGFARVGVNICYDHVFPECARILAVKGAEILLAPFTSLPVTRKAWSLERLVALRARAQDNRLFVLSASHAAPHVAGKPSEWGYSGICAAVNPLGEVLGISRGPVGRPQRLTVTMEAASLRTYLLAHVPSIRSRRPEAYAELADLKLQKAYERQMPPLGDNESANRYTALE